MSRSRAHMFAVAAARLQQEGANAKLVEDLRTAAKAEAGRHGDGRNWSELEDRRVGRQRTLMAMVPDTRAKDDLMQAMLQRAYDLMWDGDCAGTDALAEFLPSAAVEAMFQAWQSDQEGKEPKSHFYVAKGLAA